MRNEKGFTLIELVVVIVILGILAAVAVPKFVDMQVDARQSAVNGMLGSVQGAAALAHAQALVDGQTGAAGFVTMEGTRIDLVHGWPADTVAGANGTSINNAINTQGFLFSVAAGGSPATFELEADSTPADCLVQYTQPASSGAAPTINVLDACI